MRLILASLLLVGTSACFRGPKEYDPTSSERTIFLPSVRTVGPEPVYKRTRWVHLPEVVPSREDPGDHPSVEFGAPSLRPIYHLTLKDSSLEEISRVLAAMARYSSYTAPSISDRTFSIDNLGTIDELAENISQQADVHVVVDHANREIRTLARQAEEPRFFEE